MYYAVVNIKHVMHKKRRKKKQITFHITELQIKNNSCQTLGPASKRVLPDLLFFRNFLIFHFQYSMIKGTILNKGNNKITELRTILQRESQNS